MICQKLSIQMNTNDNTVVESERELRIDEQRATGF